MKVVAEAPGKLVLLGEYAVLHGASSLVAAVGRQARVTVETHQQSVSHLTALQLHGETVEFQLAHGKVRFLSELPADVRKKLELFVRLVEAAAQDRDLPPFRIELDTAPFLAADASTKLGLGSSAAVAVACWAALRALAEDPAYACKRQLLRNVLQLHHAAQGCRGSGIDVAASLYGGVMCYSRREPSRDPEVEPIRLPPGIQMIPIWSGTAASTPELLAQVESYAVRAAPAFKKHVERMARVASAGCAAARDGDSEALLSSMHDYGELLRILGEQAGAPIVSEPHQAIGRLVRERGGVYKPSGAGGGDMGTALVLSPEDRDVVVSAIGEAGYQVPALALVERGLRIERSQ